MCEYKFYHLYLFVPINLCEHIFSYHFLGIVPEFFATSNFLELLLYDMSRLLYVSAPSYCKPELMCDLFCFFYSRLMCHTDTVMCYMIG